MLGMQTVSDDPPTAWPLVVSEEEEGDDGYEGEGGDPENAPLPDPESPYWSTDDGGEEEE